LGLLWCTYIIRKVFLLFCRCCRFCPGYDILQKSYKREHELLQQSIIEENAMETREVSYLADDADKPDPKKKTEKKSTDNKVSPDNSPRVVETKAEKEAKEKKPLRTKAKVADVKNTEDLELPPLPSVVPSSFLPGGSPVPTRCCKKIPCYSLSSYVYVVIDLVYDSSLTSKHIRASIALLLFSYNSIVDTSFKYLDWFVFLFRIALPSRLQSH
jgi:hypothetical protein